VGTGVGSAMRRLFDKDMCPTKWYYLIVKNMII
jgi:hypothetical protein